eukprot:3715450-Pyramimonas_sp.AAC.1
MPLVVEFSLVGAALRNTFPEKDDAFYCHGTDIPTVKDEEELKTSSESISSVHVAALGYMDSVSLKPPPGTQKFSKLLDQMCVDGFVTGSEPLYITMPQELSDLPLPRFWSNPRNQAEIVAKSMLLASQFVDMCT